MTKIRKKRKNRKRNSKENNRKTTNETDSRRNFQYWRNTAKQENKENNKKTTNETDSRRKDTTKQEIILHPEDTTPHSLFPYMRHQQNIDSWILDTTKAKSAGQLSRSVKDRNLGTYRYHYEPDEYAMESEDEEELGWCLKPPKHGSQQDYDRLDGIGEPKNQDSQREYQYSMIIKDDEYEEDTCL